MTTTHVVRYCAAADGAAPAGLTTPAIDGVLAGFAGYTTTERPVQPGDLVLLFTSLSAATLYRVTAAGAWDPVDTQPAPGDLVVAVAPDAPLIQAGAIVTAIGDGQYRSAGSLGFQLAGCGLS